jgi:hypothetical protein
MIQEEKQEVVANLWSSELKEEPISYDIDFLENRKHDLVHADRTDYDEKVAHIVTDYVDLVKRLKYLAERSVLLSLLLLRYL